MEELTHVTASNAEALKALPAQLASVMARTLRQFAAKTMSMSSVSEAEVGGILVDIGIEVKKRTVSDKRPKVITNIYSYYCI